MLIVWKVGSSRQVGVCVVAPRETRLLCSVAHRRSGRLSGREPRCLSALATDAAGELDVLGHDGDALGVDGAEVGIEWRLSYTSFSTSQLLFVSTRCLSSAPHRRPSETAPAQQCGSCCGAARRHQFETLY